MFPCDWPVDYSSCGPCPTLGNMTTEEQAKFEEMAGEFLWLWTNRLYGTCSTTLRPCRTDCDQQATFWGMGPYPFTRTGNYYPAMVGGQWYNISCGGCGDKCSCGSPSQLKIPGPVASIESIVIGGVVLDPAAYRVDNHRTLVRQDGGTWPTCQDMGAPEGSEDSWEIHYSKGISVPVGGQIAAGILACEFAKAACKDSSCQLPERMKNVTRQGVTVTIFDDFKDIEGGKTGIYLIDTWVSSVTKAPLRPTVRTPDLPSPRHRMTTWRAP